MAGLRDEQEFSHCRIVREITAIAAMHTIGILTADEMDVKSYFVQQRAFGIAGRV